MGSRASGSPTAAQFFATNATAGLPALDLLVATRRLQKQRFAIPTCARSIAKLSVEAKKTSTITRHGVLQAARQSLIPVAWQVDRLGLLESQGGLLVVPQAQAFVT